MIKCLKCKYGEWARADYEGPEQFFDAMDEALDDGLGCSSCFLDFNMFEEMEEDV